MTRGDDLEAILKRLEKLEHRQFELATKVATLAMLLAEREKPEKLTRNTPPEVHTERWRSMQKLAFEIGNEFGQTRADLAEMKKRYGG